MQVTMIRVRGCLVYLHTENERMCQQTSLGCKHTVAVLASWTPQATNLPDPNNHVMDPSIFTRTEFLFTIDFLVGG